MTHYLPAIIIARRALLSLCLIALIPLNEIKSNPSINRLIIDQCFPENSSDVDRVHLYFEDRLTVTLSDLPGGHDLMINSGPPGYFLDLMAEINAFKIRLPDDNESLNELETLTERLQTDVFMLGLICSSNMLSAYVMDYAYLDRKSNYYSIKLNWLMQEVSERRISEDLLFEYFKVVLHFLDQFYSSGLINAHRKNEQTSKYQFLEKMLSYLIDSQVQPQDKAFIDEIFRVSRIGEVGVNRFILTLDNSYSEIFRELLVRIEPMEISLFKQEPENKFLEKFNEWNSLRDKYYKMVQLSNPVKDHSDILSSEEAQTTIFSFLDGQNHLFQYVYDSDEFQLIRHPKCLIDEAVMQVIQVMDQALLHFSGDSNALLEVDEILTIISDRLMDQVEIALSPNIMIVTDGQLCFFPFELIKCDENRYLFENHEIIYQFDFQSKMDNISIAQIHEVHGDFEGRIKLAGFESSTEVTLEGFQSEASENSLLHLSTHQIIKDGEPYILLSERDSLSRSDWFRFPDIRGVMMSMCAGLRGLPTSGENARSFGHRAYETGAENIISSLWPVDDYATNKLMESYFDNLSMGMDSDGSLRNAKLSYLKEVDQFHRHPVFWAAFVHYGGSYHMIERPNYAFLLIFVLIPVAYFKWKIRIRIF